LLLQPAAAVRVLVVLPVQVLVLVVLPVLVLVLVLATSGAGIQQS
jgi:hypothetical protein